MQKIKRYDPDNFIKIISSEKGMLSAEEYLTYGQPYIVIGRHDEALLKLQEAGYCVMVELHHLRGKSEEEIVGAICNEEAVTQYDYVCIDAAQLPEAYFRRVWCKYIGEPVIIADTKRLIIRESVEGDADAFAKLYRDEVCKVYLEIPPVELCGDEETDVAEFRRYIGQYQAGQYAFYEYGMWSVIEKESGRCIGRAGLEIQGDVLCLGYAILPQYRRKGYATEACLAVLDYCEECGYAEEVFVNIDAENIASEKVYKKISADRDMLKKFSDTKMTI